MNRARAKTSSVEKKHIADKLFSWLVKRSENYKNVIIHFFMRQSHHLSVVDLRLLQPIKAESSTCTKTVCKKCKSADLYVHNIFSVLHFGNWFWTQQSGFSKSNENWGHAHFSSYQAWHWKDKVCQKRKWQIMILDQVKWTWLCNTIGESIYQTMCLRQFYLHQWMVLWMVVLPERLINLHMGHKLI